MNLHWQKKSKNIDESDDDEHDAPEDVQRGGVDGVECRCTRHVHADLQHSH